MGVVHLPILWSAVKNMGYQLSELWGKSMEEAMSDQEKLRCDECGRVETDATHFGHDKYWGAALHHFRPVKSPVAPYCQNCTCESRNEPKYSGERLPEMFGGGSEGYCRCACHRPAAPHEGVNWTWERGVGYQSAAPDSPPAEKDVDSFDPIEEMARLAVAALKTNNPQSDAEHAAIIARHYRDLAADIEAERRWWEEAATALTKQADKDEKQVRAMVLAARELLEQMFDDELATGGEYSAQIKLRAILEQFKDVK